MKTIKIKINVEKNHLHNKGHRFKSYKKEIGKLHIYRNKKVPKVECKKDSVSNLMQITTNIK
jgi:hypothetical protein